MLPIFLIALQSVGPQVPETPRLQASPQCPEENPGEDIVVCARRAQPYRLKRMPERYEQPAVPKAEVRIGNSKLAVETERGAVLGATSNRAMLRFKLPF